MKNIQLKCTLLSDVIINERAATEGNQKTLDFIPGNAFLGVVAGELYKNESDSSQMFALFHSGKVRFGDAHPLVNKQRALRVPASWYYPKNDGKTSLFVHHGMPGDLKDDDGNPIQIKQCRSEFIVKNEDLTVSEVQINKHFAIKSAYSSENRRAEDAKMYGYQSLESGSEWCFEVQIDDEVAAFESAITKALTGKKRIGRSSTAQYGLVKIELERFHTAFRTGKTIQEKEKENVVFIYAESRLIFFDENGQPTFAPTAQQLGLHGATIDWRNSQIRTFQYAPYNNHRKTRDADRCGIEKGSVFCISGATIGDLNLSQIENGIGNYLNEGFGKVLVNPEFLEYTDDKGKAKFSFVKDKKKDIDDDKSTTVYDKNLAFANEPDGDVWKYLVAQIDANRKQTEIYKKVNEYVNDYRGKSFEGKEKFASQWGTIRSIAMNFKHKEELKNELFKEKTREEREKKAQIKEGFLVHGIAAEKWEGAKVQNLKDFIEKLDDGIVQETLVNLAAEMAKKCKKEDKR